MRRLGTVALRISHCPANDYVGHLGTTHEREELLVIVGSALCVDVEGDRVAGANGVESNAALKAGPGPAPQLALHLELGDEVVRLGRNVEKTVDLATADLAADASQFGPLGCQPVRLRHRVDGRPNNRVVDGLRYTLAHKEDVHLASAQRIYVIVRRDDRASEVGPQGFHVKHRTILLDVELQLDRSPVTARRRQLSRRSYRKFGRK